MVPCQFLALFTFGTPPVHLALSLDWITEWAGVCFYDNCINCHQVPEDLLGKHKPTGQSFEASDSSADKEHFVAMSAGNKNMSLELVRTLITHRNTLADYRCLLIVKLASHFFLLSNRSLKSFLSCSFFRQRMKPQQLKQK